MNLILEQIIRHILLEQRTVGKIKSISDKVKNLAKADGALMAYAIKVKGTSDPEKIKQLVIGATMASTGGDTESSEPVGSGSKYGRSYDSTTGVSEYRYVMSKPISKKNQLIYVWIIPNKLDEFNKTLNDKSADKSGSDIINVVAKNLDKIGAAPLVTIDEYNSQINDYNKQSKEFNLPTLTPLKNLSSLKSEEQPEEPESKETKPNQDVNQDIYLDEPKTGESKVDMNVDTGLKSEPRQTITYPYEFTNAEGVKLTIYTLSDSDENVYTNIDGKWVKTNKERFERGTSIGPDEVTDKQTIQKLNALTGQPITPAQVKSKQQLKPADTNKKDKQKSDTNIKPVDRKFKANEALTLSKTTLYEYNITNNTVKRIGSYDPARGKEPTEYRRTSADKKYIQVYFKKSKVLAWVPYNTVK